MQRKYVKIEIFYFHLVVNPIDGVIVPCIFILLTQLYATHFSEIAGQGFKRFGWWTNWRYVKVIAGFDDYLISSLAILCGSSKKSVTLFLWTSLHVFSKRSGVRQGKSLSMALR